MQSFLLRVRFYVASALNAVLLFLQTQRSESGERPIHLFTNLRHRRFFRPEAQPTRVGLYNLRYLSYPHVLARLSIREWLWGLALAHRTFRAAEAHCQTRCRELGEDWSVFRRLVLHGRLLHADTVLHAMAFEKYGGEIWTAGHFDRYLGIASQLRERNALGRLSACQHGLFEYPPKGRTYEAIFPDEYYLLFPESRRWVEANFIKNRQCCIYLAPFKSHIEYETLPREPGKKVVAFAAQELHPLDDPIVQRILSLKSRVEYGIDVLVYAHPLFPRIADRCESQGIRVFATERHHNIDVLVTRFSTLGIDYHRLGVRVLFVPFEDEVCVFEHGSMTVCSDLEEFELELLQSLEAAETTSGIP